jgi:hypothetical protein
VVVIRNIAAVGTTVLAFRVTLVSQVNINQGTIHVPTALGVLLGGILVGHTLPVHIVHRVNIKLHLMLRVVIPVLRENINHTVDIVIVGTVLRDNIRTGGPKEAAKRVLRVFTTLKMVDRGVRLVHPVNILTNIIEQDARDVLQVNTKTKVPKLDVKIVHRVNIRILITRRVAKVVMWAITCHILVGNRYVIRVLPASFKMLDLSQVVKVVHLANSKIKMPRRVARVVLRDRIRLVVLVIVTNVQQVNISLQQLIRIAQIAAVANTKIKLLRQVANRVQAANTKIPLVKLNASVVKMENIKQLRGLMLVKIVLLVNLLPMIS